MDSHNHDCIVDGSGRCVASETIAAEVMQKELTKITWAKDWIPVIQELAMNLPHTRQEVNVGMGVLYNCPHYDFTPDKARRVILVGCNYGFPPEATAKLAVELING